MPKHDVMRGYNKHFKGFISKEVKDYATNNVLHWSRYIFIFTQGEKRIGYCTHCHKEHEIKCEWKHNGTMNCPKCNHSCTVKDAKYKHSRMLDASFMYFFKKSKADSNVVVGELLYICRDYRESFRDVETEFYENAKYCFEIGNAIMFDRRYGEWGQSQSVFPLTSLWGYPQESNHFSDVSLREAVKDTPLEHMYNDCCVNWDHAIRQLAKFCKYPFIEMLYKGSFKDLVKQHSYRWKTYRTLNWKATTVHGFFKLSKNCYGRIKEEHIDFCDLYLIQLFEKKKRKWALTQVKELVRAFSNTMYHNRRIAAFEKLNNVITPTQMINYISKQLEVSAECYSSQWSVTSDWLDYIDECRKIGYDIKESQINRPKNLQVAHSRTSDIIYQLQEEERRLREKERRKAAAELKKKEKEAEERFEKQWEKMKDKYYFEYNGLFVVPAKTVKQIVKEGKELHHCVGGYAKRHIEGRTNIFFVRKKTEPDTSYYTMEIVDLKQGKVTQCRGMKNASYENNDKVLAFVNEFIKAKLEIKKVNRRKSA